MERSGLMEHLATEVTAAVPRSCYRFMGARPPWRSRVAWDRRQFASRAAIGEQANRFPSCAITAALK